MTETCHRSRVSRDVRRVMYAANVAEAVGDITHGCEIYGLARGQYSLIDLVEHILGFTGPARLTSSAHLAAPTSSSVAGGGLLLGFVAIRPPLEHLAGIEPTRETGRLRARLKLAPVRAGRP